MVRIVSEDPPKNENMWFRTLFGFAIALIAGVILLHDLVVLEAQRIAVVKSDANEIVTALDAYKTEYGKYPGLDRQTAFSNAESNAFLMQILRGHDKVRNPRGFMFCDPRKFDPSRHFKFTSAGGYDPKSGVFFDPWGNPYCIAVDSGSGQIASPYSDESPITTGIIVWSLGKDGKQGSPANPHTSKGSDDVTSWQ